MRDSVIGKIAGGSSDSLERLRPRKGERPKMKTTMVLIITIVGAPHQTRLVKSNAKMGESD